MSAVDLFPILGHAVRAVILGRTLFICLWSVAIFLEGMSYALAEPTSADGQELFREQIEPALVQHCYECHSQQADQIEAGLELDSSAGLLRGGDSGPILTAHEVDGSPLLSMLRYDNDVSGMPPDGPLPDELIAAFAEWIRLGAPDPREAGGPTAREQREAVGRNHWAFQPPKQVEPPRVQETDWPRDQMDHFVLARMEAENISPVGDANRRTLVRRVYFDLVGLPPSPEEVEAFVTDDSNDSLARLIDRLLDSPRFGERWGRHWLDVVRFAESSGMEFNFTYPHAWPYRNYVIDSLNEDKPYDEFLREQIAGDLMDTDDDESAEVMEARRIAPSMLAFGPKQHNQGGMTFRMGVVDDQINTVSQAMLALTVGCARCHDHKFDPIPTTEYYALAGIFLSTEPIYGTIQQKYSNNPTDPLPIGPNAETRHAAAEEHQAKIKGIEVSLALQREELAKQQELDGQASDEKTDAESAEVANLKTEVASFEATIEDFKQAAPPRPHYAMSARDRAVPADAKIALRGELGSPGEVAPRGFLTAFEVLNAPSIEPSNSGRLELSEWIASPENPLTARVAVNRIWHHLFGRGLVPTVDNFGVIGKPPSHPQLLDELAVRFMRDGWSVKRMIRTIMLSRSYQLSSMPNSKNMEIDPGNRLYWRATPRRLEAEVIRDAVLTVSGQLDLERPDGSTVTSLGDQMVRGIPTDKIQPASRHRSVYLPVVRDYVPEFFDLFDFPSPSLVSGRRSVTNVPSQALYLRNSPFVAEQSRYAARRLLAIVNVNDDSARVDFATRWALARPATNAEREGAMRLIDQIKLATPEGEQREVHAWSAWFHTLFTTAEFRYLVDIKSVD
ncbi:MAG: PSD1 and planctomycete cytochrome C domain-containing protein [Aeoliella sp.]